MLTTTYFNVVVNGEAESNYVSDFTTYAIPFGWERPQPQQHMTAVAYAIGGADDLNAADSAAVGGGNAYFAGGPGPNSILTQDFDITPWAAIVDAGALNFDFSADLGGWLGQSDQMTATVAFFGDGGAPLLGKVDLTVTAADRGNITELLHRAGAGTVPVGTREVIVELYAVNHEGDYNDGYADNIKLTYSAENAALGIGVIPGDHDYRAETLPPIIGLAFETAGDSTAIFRPDQLPISGATWIGDAHKNVISIALGASHSFDAKPVAFFNWTSGQDLLKISGSNTADTIAGSSGSDQINARGGNDIIDISQWGPTAVAPLGHGGADRVSAGDGDDVIMVSADFALDRIDGRAGSDTVHFVGAAPGPVTLKAAALAGVELILLDDVGAYAFKSADATVAAGATLTVDGVALVQAGHGLDFNGAKESDGHFVLIGGLNAANHLTGGSLSDVLKAGSAADQLSGRGGADTFVFDRTPHQATITDFSHGDVIDLHNIDANTAKGGDQAFHLGATAGHAGDLVIAYSAGNDRTTISVYLDGNTSVDGVLKLNGDHTDLSAADFML